MVPRSPAGELQMVWYAWWFPLLRPGVNYFPTSVADIAKKIQWCVDNDEACEAVGRKSRALMAQLTLDTTYDYLHRILSYVHNLQNNATTV